MKIHETMVTTVGVYRCCVSSVGVEHLEGGEVEYGDTSNCKHCDGEFELVNQDGRNVWIPVNDNLKMDK